MEIFAYVFHLHKRAISRQKQLQPQHTSPSCKYFGIQFCATPLFPKTERISFDVRLDKTQENPIFFRITLFHTIRSPRLWHIFITFFFNILL